MGMCLDGVNTNFEVVCLGIPSLLEIYDFIYVMEAKNKIYTNMSGIDSSLLNLFHSLNLNIMSYL